MKRLSVIFWFLPLSLVLASCIRSVSVPFRTVTPVLVAEGWITTDDPPYAIHLSYSGAFSNTYQAGILDSGLLYINDAQVSILDDLGDSTACLSTGLGTYLSADPQFIGTIGRSYRLKVNLSNGKTYVSRPETITPVPGIDSVTAAYDSTSIYYVRPTQLILSVNFRDPPSNSNYYRWTSLGYFPRKSWGFPCTTGSPPCTDPFMCSCYALCEQLQYDNQVNVLSDQFIEGHEIRDQPVYYSPVYWKGIHYVQIKQSSISQQAYEFWEQYLNQTNRTGSILDPLPAPLIGNIYNQADTTDIALGLFSGSATITKKVIIIPDFLQTYLLEAIAGSYIKAGDCHFDYPNSLQDDAIPGGWDGAQVIFMK
jgi:hypothetical protein